jgi:hypothetical protein
MDLDKNRVEVFDDDDRAEMDLANDRVDAEMKLLESEAKAQVAQGLQDPKIAKEAERLRQQAESELRSLDEEKNDNADQ